MFTGIIQNLGRITNFNKGEMEVATKLDLSDCNVGSSISCNGVCLTAIEIIHKDETFFFKVNIGEETQNRTNFSSILKNEFMDINIEKSLKIGDEISGHFVYGHVDQTTKVIKIVKLKNSWELYFENFTNKNSRFIVEKGSIAINGISLTIANVERGSFSISVIPHTFNNTNIKYLKVNGIVNIEFDYLARFLLRKD